MKTLYNRIASHRIASHRNKRTLWASVTLIALFGLSACGDGGNDVSNANDSGAQSATLASPTGVTLTKDLNAKTIKISWTAVPEAKSYTVYSAEQSASSLGENGFTNHSTLNGHATQTGITATEYTLSNLTQGNTYYVLVQTVNDSTQSAYKASDEKSTALIRFEKLSGYEGKCVIDHKNNLIWEVKQDDVGLHGKGHQYSWYNPDSNTNGGVYPGRENSGKCYNKKTDSNPNGNACDTTGFVSAVKAEKWCGFTDWRMPTIDELKSLVDEGRKAANTRPMIDTDFFPNTQASNYWSSTPKENDSDGQNALYVDLYSGIQNDTFKGHIFKVRLVRAR